MLAQRRQGAEMLLSASLSASPRLCARKIYARGPVSRVLYPRLRENGDHSSRTKVALRLQRPTRATSRNRPMCRPYSVLHPVGFTVPSLLPVTRCALAAPFQPYPSEAGRCVFCGTFPDSCRSRSRRALPGTVVPWSPDFPRQEQAPAAAARSPGRAPYRRNCLPFRVSGRKATSNVCQAWPRSCSRSVNHGTDVSNALPPAIRSNSITRSSSPRSSS
jgi:hypothetical protein